MVNLFKCNTDELKALVIYKDVLENNGRFPRNFWNDNSGNTNVRNTCSILTRYCLENIARIEPSGLPEYNLKQLKEVITANKLFGMLQIVFHSDMLTALENSYPSKFSSGELRAWMWSRHGVWYNDDAVIEAVKRMVLSEGITRFEDIPRTDWKKKLLRHGIYNILARFNWSIFDLFDFVYPGRFHHADFKYKIKWSTPDSSKNAYYLMNKTFREKGYSNDDILMLGTSGFRQIGLTAMLISQFDSSALLAKEYYLFGTRGDKSNIRKIKYRIAKLNGQKLDFQIRCKLDAASSGRNISNLHANSALYSYLKRMADKKKTSIGKLISSYGYVYKKSRKDPVDIDRNVVWNLRRQRLTYINIAKKLNSNAAAVVSACNRYFGGDPLIPRPIENYTTIQELMDKYHVDHKTIMKLVRANKFENHTTIRFRYLKKSEIEPALKKYAENSKQHISMVERYGSADIS